MKLDSEGGPIFLGFFVLANHNSKYITFTMQSIVSRFVRAGTVAARRSNNVRVALSRRYTTNDKGSYLQRHFSP